MQLVSWTNSFDNRIPAILHDLERPCSDADPAEPEAPAAAASLLQWRARIRLFGMETNRSAWRLVMVGLLALAWGCSPEKVDEPAARVVGPSDFAASQPSDASAAPAKANPIAGEPKTPAASSRPQAAAAATVKPGVSTPVDAMVGQVNGRPIYAGRVFESIHEALAAIGKRTSPQGFRREAESKIRGAVFTIVLETLIVAEAEATLNPQQQMGLRHLLKEQRAELVRSRGAGSEKAADQRLRREGSSLDEKMEEIRKQAVIQNHMRQKIAPKINISRKDVRNYYRRHSEQFNPKPGRTIHMIHTKDPATADKIDRLLAEGTPFLEIAGNAELNQYKPDQEGFYDKGLTGDRILVDPLNEPTLALEADQHTSRIALGQKLCWVHVKTISTGKARSLIDVQSEIRAFLYRQRRRQLDREYHAELLRKGSLDPRGTGNDPLSVMVDALMEIAANRYAMPE